jgi:hypothetical protein
MSFPDIPADQNTSEETTSPDLLGSLGALAVLYAWDAFAGRYVEIASGNYVPFTEVREALEANISAAQQEIKRVTQMLIDGDLSLDDWQTSMMDQIKLIHINSAVAARGGWAQMTQSDWGYVGRQIRTQYEYLRNFVAEIQNGIQPLNGRALMRANMYGDAARGTFEDMRRRVEELVYGMQEEMRVLGIADHCVDCLAAANRWAPIGTLPRIGNSRCKTNCHCRFRFRAKKENGQYQYRDP